MIFNILLLVFFVIVLNWNIGLYNLALEAKGRIRLILIILNIFLSIVLGLLSIFY